MIKVKSVKVDKTFYFYYEGKFKKYIYQIKTEGM